MSSLLTILETWMKQVPVVELFKTGETRCDFGSGTKRCDKAYFHLHNKSSESLSSVCFLITQGKGFRVRQVVFKGRVSLLPACL